MKPSRIRLSEFRTGAPRALRRFSNRESDQSACRSGAPFPKPESEDTRWAMERGFYAVLDVRQSPTADRAKDFETLANKAKRAHSAIEELLRYLDPDARKGADLELALLTAQAGIQKNSDARALHDLARHDGECLWMAREVLEWLVKFLSASQRRRLARKCASGGIDRRRRKTRRHGIRDPSIQCGV